ncbi:bifunctional [glutamate--ammonia ligase]-adenylyl-L-tyrosine phosphorylase/[glutamate--ammonia-ligase] adenylyltransferase [Methylophilus aquaticus]|uniref:Bifunctional glutamine synthetase adenylyltransferase/adenylyl-removing enzyme n=1 Tax=Methylophilus aquaticus TaxID=1971610 RepID=A0ABT9JSV9_9PROT|nr:bifunctional [glutamate--ammonia ligase]-adenylyl-L-tyrosine phosphorylase/[glutamate--ammonia-ligase] adenylyltransferase [Methylophilus aquaticus]MDP8567673.1 bifunctional [glutamate--ammonia ligase]-adenylyl-L-tyrosine phosphorylase/[glutamate--ammonia-ligase] adenylyltransferase [Methylophilus aquaticus]
MQQLDQILTEKQIPSTEAAYLLHAAQCSPFFARLVTKHTDFINDLVDNLYKRYKSKDVKYLFLDKIISEETTFLQQIRKNRQFLLAHMILRDLNALADFHEVVETTSAMAEAAIACAADFYHAQLCNVYGVPRNSAGEPQQLIVVGMGKLGGLELNVSSDIDLIFAYECDGATDGEKSISNQDFFTRLGKKLISALDEVTADGFVFRVDMRLRPFGSEGALVCNLDALEDYYQNYGREWERYAWIKGRVVYGPALALTKLIKPFIFRKYLDFNAYASMRDLKMQIQRDVVQRRLSDNIKLGRGGIREIEFIAQLFQLIRGGQVPDLQIKPTLAVLDCLAEREMLPEEDVQALKESYLYLRNLEHRLMYIDDQQTQDLPASETYRQHLLNMLRLPDWASFMQMLNSHRDRVQHFFDDTFRDSQSEGLQQESALWQGTVSGCDAEQWLQAQGYTRAADIWHLLQNTHNSQKIQQLPESSRRRFDSLMPLLLREAAQQQATTPDTALIRTLDLLESICRRASYLALLTEFPDALSLIVKLCAASPWIAQYVSAHPILLDELLNKQTLFKRIDAPVVKAELSRLMQQLTGDVEAQMDAIRHFKHAHVLKIAAQDLMTALPLEAISDDLSALAEVVLQVSLQTVWHNLSFKHREIPQFAVIGYGKLGGKELGYLSDLDIIFLYDDEAENAQEVYARFAQRLNTWFNTLTNAGLLYETDLQLRPDGNSGLLVSSLQAFDDYQNSKAWVWEHQAITRARFVAGEPAIGAAFEHIRHQILCQPREPLQLKAEISAMREKMREAHKSKVGTFDIKQGRGGIVDVEFVVQYLVLAYATKHGGLTENIGNIALLQRCASLGLLPSAQFAEQVAAAYRDYRTFIHHAKLQGQEAIVADSEMLAQRAVVDDAWQLVFN